MTEEILLVDDEPNVLLGYKRQFWKQYSIHTALGGEQALNLIRSRPPFAVIVSDMRMPGMDGVQFLSAVRDLSPDSVRIALTGVADLRTAIDAVNEGSVFRFLTKPCPAGRIGEAIDAGIHQYRLVQGERELLEKTLAGSIKVLTDVLSLVNPTAFGRASQVTRLVRQIAAEVGLGDVWQLEIAAMLSQVGCVTVPEDALGRLYNRDPLSAEDQQIFAAHPRVGQELIANIPRLERVARVIGLQDTRFDTTPPALAAEAGEWALRAARILKVALDYDILVSSGMRPNAACAELRGRAGHYDPEVVDALERSLLMDERYETRFIRVDQLAPEMILVDDLRNARGALVMARGQEVTPALLARLRNLGLDLRGDQPMRVLVPRKQRPKQMLVG